MRDLYLDVETISTISVVTHGVYAHAADPTLDITMAAFAIDDAPVTLWTSPPEIGSVSTPPPALEAALLDPDTLVWAHNAAYERHVIAAVWGIDIPLRRWRDSAVVARWCNLPGKLETLSKYLLGADAAKLTISPQVKFLWSTASLPWKPEDASAFDEMGVYCIRDVEAMRGCIRAMPTLPDIVWQEYAVSEVINDRGVRIDVPFAEAVLPLRRALDDEIGRDLAAALGVNDPDARQSPRSPDMRKWMEARVATHANQTLLDAKGHLTRGFKKRRKDGVGFYTEVRATFDKPMRAKVREFMEEVSDHRALDVLDLIDEGQNAAITKYSAAVARVSPDDRLRGMYMFSGAAQTHRFSSTGVQTHNMLRETLDLDDDHDLRAAIRTARTPKALLDSLPPALRTQGLGKVLSKALRSTIMANPDHDLIWGDWSAIEARVLPWLANDTAKLRMFESGVDVYRVNACALFGLPSPDAASKDQRQVGKVQELALGFGGGKGAFAAMSRGYGVRLDDAMVAKAVKDWRVNNPVIVGFWFDLEQAAFTAMRPSNWRKPFTAGRIAYVFAPDIAFGSLIAVLPDGSMLVYPNARIETITRFEDQPEEAAICFDHPTYGRVSLWHGTLAENVTQAVAACLLRDALARAAQAGMIVVAHTHDEIVIEAPLRRSDDMLAALPDLMCQAPSWAQGLPLAAEAGRGSRYKIDDSGY